MTIKKQCVDQLRAHVFALTGNKLVSGHAHELVAAFFGYKSASALRAETQCPLTNLDKAKFLFPDLETMDVRVKQLRGLPSNLPNIDQLASEIADTLVVSGHFDGEVWLDRKHDDEVNDYVQKNSSLIEEALSGKIAETNAYFDELYIDEYGYQRTRDAFIVTLEGALNGETHEDRTFMGDKIAFSSTMTFRHIAGRVACEKPEFETSGSVDDTGYYDPE